MKQKILDFLKSNIARTFYWTTLVNAFGLAMILVADLDFVYAPLILAVLNGATKYINKTYL